MQIIAIIREVMRLQSKNILNAINKRPAAAAWLRRAGLLGTNHLVRRFVIVLCRAWDNILTFWSGYFSLSTKTLLFIQLAENLNLQFDLSASNFQTGIDMVLIGVFME